MQPKSKRVSIWIQANRQSEVTLTVNRLQKEAEELGLRLKKSTVLRAALLKGLSGLQLEDLHGANS